MLFASKKDKKWICSLLADSFELNNSVNYIVKQDKKRKKRKKRIYNLMCYSFNECIRNGIVAYNENKDTAMLCSLPARSRFSFSRLKNNFFLLFCISGIKKISKIIRRENYIKNQHPKSDFAYLWFIGVNQQIQGKGNGSKMIKDFLKWANEKNLPVYLETSNPRNLEFYIKNGFTLFHTCSKDFFGYEFWFFTKN